MMAVYIIPLCEQVGSKNGLLLLLMIFSTRGCFCIELELKFWVQGVLEQAIVYLGSNFKESDILCFA